MACVPVYTDSRCTHHDAAFLQCDVDDAIVPSVQILRDGQSRPWPHHGGFEMARVCSLSQLVPQRSAVIVFCVCCLAG